MNSKRREFLKKTAIGSAGVVGLATMSFATTPENLKKDSGKKKEVLYKRTPDWDLYYRNAK
ncbi:putative formate dehydrogenase-associated protein [Campylobacter blaseri]|uniref:Tat pathway signal protein n=1 Tax=Campylobacter blaseri TaxID=2042961 RepID=A0A2P8R493_9BACT|nr:twin-arginine translocation signal domain-containing protein [Campylobacter blaseri]PSM53299.1 hypothetical protein CQ405_01780 [Campylobacter blaseri]PSM54765.1 hypothetical protein CRN67_01780 [Campylobacter blaseri]QKF86752.1 putative formate dehydrogenase-associated protein [Campylobacter blaseri]